MHAANDAGGPDLRGTRAEPQARGEADEFYERQLAALDKHRGKGQQKITVEHVTVQAGGQAIVDKVSLGERESGDAPPALGDLSVEPLDFASLAPARQKRKRPVGRSKK